jgi:two-component system response regulator YesN
MLDTKIREEAFIYYESLRKLKCLVESSGVANLTLKRAAEIGGLDRNYFSTFFHAKVGITFTRWRQLQRVKLAMTLLQEDDTKIIQIAHRIGFGDLSSFQRAFKQIVGMCPRNYRKQYRPEYQNQ